MAHREGNDMTVFLHLSTKEADFARENTDLDIKFDRNNGDTTLTVQVSDLERLRDDMAIAEKEADRTDKKALARCVMKKMARQHGTEWPEEGQMSFQLGEV